MDGLDEARAGRRKQIVLRVGFLVLLAGGLLLWARLRMPRQLSVVIDLAEALPGEVSEVDVVVTREGRAIARMDRRYPPGGAPQRIALEVRARPGSADVDATLVYPGKPARRTRATVQLAEDQPASVAVR